MPSLFKKKTFFKRLRDSNYMVGTRAVSMPYLFKYPMTHILQCCLDCMNTFTLSSSSLHDKASGRFMGVLSFTRICINGSKHFLHKKYIFSSNSQMLKRRLDCLITFHKVVNTMTRSVC